MFLLPFDHYRGRFFLLFVPALRGGLHRALLDGLLGFLRGPGLHHDRLSWLLLDLAQGPLERSSRGFIFPLLFIDLGQRLRVDPALRGGMLRHRQRIFRQD